MNVSLPYKAATYYTILRPSRSRLSHKQEMERPHSEGKQHQLHSSNNFGHAENVLHPCLRYCKGGNFSSQVCCLLELWCDGFNNGK